LVTPTVSRMFAPTSPSAPAGRSVMGAPLIRPSSR
jgi:hypothetical protein